MTKPLISSKTKLLGLLGGLAAGVLTLLACQSGMPLSNTAARIQAQNNLAQQRSPLQVAVLAPEKIPTELQTRTQAQAQVYADEVSKRRGIDLFYVHAVPVALQLKAAGQEAWVLSYPGTSRLRTDLNLELRALVSAVSGSKAALNLNYAGPVTLGRSAQNLAEERPLLARQNSEALSFELITGLPGNGVTEAYGDYLDGLQNFLRSRFQARPFQFDDGPLIYAVHQGQSLLGFVFQNQRNRLILGERKYADVQSMVLVSSSREILGTYTLVGFNPKTTAPDQAPVYTQEDHGSLGQLFIFGEY